MQQCNTCLVCIALWAMGVREDIAQIPEGEIGSPVAKLDCASCTLDLTIQESNPAVVFTDDNWSDFDVATKGY